MSLKQIIDAWCDEEYRERLEPQTLAQLPENPAGEIELMDADLAQAGIEGGLRQTNVHPTLMGCTFGTL